MANIVDYLKWRGDLTFKQSPFNEVDNLILAEFAYINISKKDFKKNISIKEAVAFFLEKYNEQELKKRYPFTINPYQFYKEIANSKRFGNLKIVNYVNKLSKKEEKQFSAMSIKINFHTLYIAFRGTDETIVGWKEDFNMSYLEEIPSQLEAKEYIRKIPFWYRHIYLGGHSKGGNLAVYAGVKAKKKNKRRIKNIFNNDGPGFSESFIKSPSYLAMLPKIIALEPETSIIGMLLTQKSTYKVIKSNSIGLWQHDALTWQVEGTSFQFLKEVNDTSNKIQKTVASFLEHRDKKQKEVFINTLYQVLDKNNINTVEDLANLKLRAIPHLLKTFTKLEEETRKIVIESIKELIKEANQNFDKKTIFFGLKTFTKKRS